MSSRQPSEDLFDSSRMSFGEHLEELRKCLVRALWGVIPFCILGFVFANNIIQTLNKPLVDAINEYNDHRTELELIDEYGYVPPEYKGWMQQERLVPGQAFVDPGQVIKLLQREIPNLAGSLELDPYGFRAHHFEMSGVPSLCQRLADQDDSDPLIAAKLTAIWESLAVDDQKTISMYKGADSGTADSLTKVLNVFNRLSKVKALSDHEAFAEDITEPQSSFFSLLLGPPEPKPLAKLKSKLAESQDSTLSRRLNRALITSIFPDQMNELRVDLAPLEIWEKSDFEPQSLGVSESFLVWLKAGIFSGLILGGPWIAYQLWLFVASGLYPHEKKHIHVFLPISIGLFVAGVLMAFYFVFQPVLGFLFSFNRAMGITPDMRINDWLGFVMFLPIGFGLAFQLPLVMLFMHRIGLFSIEDYLSKWRIAVLIIFVIAMFLTPADPISMLLLAVPLTILYFVGIALCRWMPRIENPYADDAVLAG